jgi:hypothetical protein
MKFKYHSNKFYMQQMSQKIDFRWVIVLCSKINLQFTLIVDLLWNTISYKINLQLLQGYKLSIVLYIRIQEELHFIQLYIILSINQLLTLNQQLLNFIILSNLKYVPEMIVLRLLSFYLIFKPHISIII